MKQLVKERKEDEMAVKVMDNEKRMKMMLMMKGERIRRERG